MPNSAIKALKVQERPVASLRSFPHNARTHSAKQICQIAAAIREFGFTNPVLIDQSGVIIAGHGRIAAAKTLGLDTVPTISIEHLTEPQKRAYVIADNRLALNAGWDPDILAIEFQHLTTIDLDFELESPDSTPPKSTYWSMGRPSASLTRSPIKSRGLMRPLSQHPAIFGSWVSTAFYAAMPATRQSISGYWLTSAHASCSQTRPTTSPSTATSAVWAS
jgi:hypothetical protein